MTEPGRERAIIIGKVAAACALLAGVIAFVANFSTIMTNAQELFGGTSATATATSENNLTTPSIPPSATPTPVSTAAIPSAASTADSAEKTPTSQWYYLVDLDVVEQEIEVGCTGGCTGFDYSSARIVNTYPQSVITRIRSGGNRSVTTWNALKTCSLFEATVGLSDRSASTTASFTIDKDGAGPVPLAEVSTGMEQTIQVDMTGVYRFELAANMTTEPSSDNYTYAVWGDARLFCSSDISGQD